LSGRANGCDREQAYQNGLCEFHAWLL